MQEFLVERYGFGFDYFTSGVAKRVRAILKRNRIRNEVEYRQALDFLSDTSFCAELRDPLVKVVAVYEAEQGAS